MNKRIRHLMFGLMVCYVALFVSLNAVDAPAGSVSGIHVDVPVGR